MACFLVATVLGIILTVLRKKLPKQWRINWLIVMIFGGTIALAVEHIAHQEIVPWPPFLTAMSNPADTVAMFGEMATVGIPMTIALILGWIVIVAVYEKLIAIRTAPMSASDA